jgi:ERCC4-type nuclease
VVERKDLPDLVRSLTAERTVFINRLRLMAQCPHRWLVITDAVSQVKSPYPRTSVSPNWITQSLIAVLAGLQVPFLCTETQRTGRRTGGIVSLSGASLPLVGNEGLRSLPE